MSNKQLADQAMRAFNIEVNDLVVLSTCYLLLRSSPGKLKPRFVRSFRVTQAVGVNALELPNTMRFHPVFIFSLFHKYQGECKLPGPIIVDGEAEYKVEKFFRLHGNGKHR